jgi:hypothetical protein
MKANQTEIIVMTGLDPVIHAAPFAPSSDICACRTTWMPGSSPGMTIWEMMASLKRKI